MQDHHKLDLLSRFTLVHKQFRAFETGDDIRRLFRQIDVSQFSDSLHISWTEFFVPQAYRNGFRLEQEADAMFISLSKACEASGLPCQFPARQMFSAIRSFLLDCIDLDSATLDAGPEAWGIAIDSAMVIEAARVAAGANATGSMVVNN